MKSNFLILIFVAFTTGIFAQNTTLSPYSHFGDGQPASNRTVENSSIGGVTTYADSTQFSLENPATLGKLSFVQYRIGLGYKSTNLESSQGSEPVSTSSLNYLALSVPTKHFVFSFGLKPKTSIGYRILTTEEVDGEEQRNSFSGTGGVNSTFLAFAFTPFEGLSLGASAFYNFGFTEKTFTRSINAVQLNTQVFNRSELSGINYTLGMHYNKTVFSNYNLQVSAAYSPNSTLDSTNSRIISTINPAGGIDSQEEIELGGMEYTSNKTFAETTFGLGLGKSQQWFFGGTYSSTAKGAINPLETNPDVAYLSSSRFSLGGFYIPEYNSFTNYLKRVVYRVGARWENTGLALKNQAIKDFGITFGLGLPLGILSKLNIGVEVGQLGTQNAGLIKENYTNIMLGFSLSDVWFVKRKYD